MTRTPLEVYTDILALLGVSFLASVPEVREPLESLLMEHAFASRALALRTTAAVLRRMAETDEAEDPDSVTAPGLHAAADFMLSKKEASAEELDELLDNLVEAVRLDEQR